MPESFPLHKKYKNSSFVPLARCYAPAKASILRKLLYFFARRSYGILLQKNYRIEHHNVHFLRELKAPYILLANHVSNEDPFIYNICCPYPIAWIIGKSIERESRFPFLLRTLRCISRSKEMSDLGTIKKIRQWIADGEVVGIFPEGQTSLSGVSQPIPDATAKLLRFLKVPVVALRSEGGYFARPHWARQRRCSQNTQAPGIAIHYELLLDQTQIQTAKLEEITAKVQQALHYDPYQQKDKIFTILDLGIKKQNLAESIELVFYACLACHNREDGYKSLGMMRSNGIHLHCSHCGAAWRISDDSHFLQYGAQCYNLEQYYQGQWNLLCELAINRRLKIQYSFARLRCYRTEEEQIGHLRKSGSVCYHKGVIELDTNGLKVQQNEQMLYHFALEHIFASHVFKFNTWEFHVKQLGESHTNHEQVNTNNQSQLFVLDFPRKTDSAFLLLDSLKALQQSQSLS